MQFHYCSRLTFEIHYRRDVPQLFSELTSLYTLPVLEADYDFKIARQDYELSKHDQILYYLFRQKSRNEFLRLGFDSEMKRLQETFFIINALKAELNSMSEELLKRIVSDFTLFRQILRTGAYSHITDVI